MNVRKLLLPLLLTTTLHSQATPPFSRGLNLTNWFQYNSAHQVQFTRYTFEDFEDIQSLGVDVIRLPINLHAMTSGAPDYLVDPLLFYFLDQIVDWTEALDMHLILDNHTFDPATNTDIGIYPILMAVWPQMAEHFRERGPNLYYEILNEPHGITDLVWNTIQQNVVSAIRNMDSTHTIVVGPAGWNSYNNLDDMLLYDDDNLIYTFHFYDPFLFTHQGASWSDPSLVSLSGVPFPSGAGPLPSCPPELIGTWIQNELGNYANTGTVDAIQNTLDIAAAFSEDRGVPIYCGEFGVYIPNADPAHRVAWYQTVVQYLDSLDIAWTMWDYHGGFGLFEPGGSDLFDHDLNLPLLAAMGLNVPEQTPFVVTPDSTTFYFYQDYMAPGIMAAHSGAGELDMYATDLPKYGDFCIRWTGASQYAHIGFRFNPYRDLSALLAENFVLTFWIRAQGSEVPLDIRFIDTKTAIPEDHPWRMVSVVEPAELQWNGEWQYFQIPLTEMFEGGSWDNAWYEALGLFDWSAIQQLEIVAEQAPLGDAEFWFDEIRLVDGATASLQNTPLEPRQMTLGQNFPNPFNASTLIPFTLTHSSESSLTIFDIQGRVVKELALRTYPAGIHQLSWDGRDDQGRELCSGVYLAQLRLGQEVHMVKISLLK